MRAVVRGLVVAVVSGVLAASAGCQGSESVGGSRTPLPTPTTGIRESTPAASSSVFLGQGSDTSASQVSVPTAKVGEPADGDVAVVNPSGDPVTVQNIAATTDSGETSIVEDTCTGVELPPGGSCRIRVQHIATEAGSYTGELTATTSDGNVLTAAISGEALGEATPSDEDTAGTETPSPSPSLSLSPSPSLPPSPSLSPSPTSDAYTSEPTLTD
ncbi:hypothetical protein AB0D29_08070 [Streptomyces sp. NPDC048424]|uniref:hypothetical protein n=1 Tax=Streptomyces sp. NPDC048424 TaxID=3155265 RepID=UPI003440A080